MITEFWRAQRARIERMPRLFRFLGVNGMFGAAVGVALAASMVLTNAGGLNDLISGDGHPYLTIFALFYLFALTFAAVAMGIAIMTMPHAKGGRNDVPRNPDDYGPLA